MANDNIPLVFISYASPDKDLVLPYFESLKSPDYEIWMDCKKLVGGQDWDFEIKRNFSKAQIIILFLSKNSTNKRGYVQRELKLALQNLEEKLRDDIYIIPVLLDDVSIPDELQDLHCIKNDGFFNNLDEIKKALAVQLEKLNIYLKIPVGEGKIKWRIETKREFRDGLPGYDVSCQLIDLYSEDFNNLDEISNLINAHLSFDFMKYRENLLEQDSAIFNYGTQQFRRINSIEKNCATVTVVGRVLSVQYSNYYMGARAAHGNIYFDTFNFLLDFPIQIKELKDIFEDHHAARKIIQDCVIEYAMENIYEDDVDVGVKKGLEEAVADWYNFDNFIFNEKGIEIFFPPYALAAYAYGPQIVEIPYDKVGVHIKDIYQSFLEIYIHQD